jgi:hypothetical protein
MKYKFINKWSDFILNETLKTNDIDFVLKNVDNELSLLGFNFSINKNDNTIELTINEFYSLQNINTIFDYINSLFIDRNGWFPSKYKLINLSGSKNTLQYDEEYLINNKNHLKTVNIIYEPKYDIEVNIPEKLYHLSIQNHNLKIIKNGLIPKSKNKISKHLDRIYVCRDYEDCYKLIPRMKINYINSKIPNTKWIIYDIDTHNLNIKLYKDPNYSNGYYIIDNIPPDNIKIFDKE